MPKSSSRACSPAGARGEHHVLRLEVAVDDALVVDGRQPLGELHQDPASALGGERSAAQRAGGASPPRRTPSPGRSRRATAEVDDPDHRRVLDAGEQARLAPEALAHARLLAHLPAEHLQARPAGPGSPARPGTPRPCRHPRGDPARESVRPRTSEFGSSTANRHVTSPAGPRLTVVRVPTHRAIDRKRPLFGAPRGRVVPSPTAPFMASEDTSGGSVPPAPDGRVAGPELRLLDRRAFVGFPPVELRPGITVVDFGLQIPDVSFPFNVGGGRPEVPAAEAPLRLPRGRDRRRADPPHASRRRPRSALEVSDVVLNFRQGWLEGEARLKGPSPAGSDVQGRLRRRR